MVVITYDGDSQTKRTTFVIETFYVDISYESLISSGGAPPYALTDTNYEEIMGVELNLQAPIDSTTHFFATFRMNDNSIRLVGAQWDNPT